MKILDRFTRDRHSRSVWAGATLLFLLLALGALAGGRMALSDEEQASEEVAVEYTDTVLFDALDADLLGDEIRGRNYRDLIIQVQGGIMTDEGVARVRIWAPDGTLLFSTESLEQIGVAKAVNSAPIEGAVQGEVTSVISEATVAAKSGLTGSTQRLFQTYAPIRVRERTAILGVAEVDRTYASISDAAAQPWRALQIGFGVATLLCAVLMILSLRRSTAAFDAVGITPPREDVPVAPVPDDLNALRLRNELVRERQANRKLQAELEATTALGGPPGPPAPPAQQVSPAAEEEAAALIAAREHEAAALAAAREHEAAALAAARDAEAEAARLAAAQLAEAEAAIAEAGAHTAELERELANARAQAVPPEALANLEERVIAAEARARQAEVRLQDLAAAPHVAPPAPVDGPPAGAPPRSEPPAPPDEDEQAPLPMDLRSRLARTAARKKLGSHPDDEPGA